MGGARSTYGRQTMCIQGFEGEIWGKWSTWKTYSYAKWDDKIKMDLREKGFEEVDWTDVAHDKKRWRGIFVKR